MILYAVMAQKSVVKMFVAGIIPGILGAVGADGRCAYYHAWKNDFPVEQRFSLARVWQALKEASWALMLPVIILGGIFGGFVTATEGAALAVVAALFIGGVHLPRHQFEVAVRKPGRRRRCRPPWSCCWWRLRADRQCS